MYKTNLCKNKLVLLPKRNNLIVQCSFLHVKILWINNINNLSKSGKYAFVFFNISFLHVQSIKISKYKAIDPNFLISNNSQIGINQEFRRSFSSILSMPKFYFLYFFLVVKLLILLILNIPRQCTFYWENKNWQAVDFQYMDWGNCLWH